HGGVLQEAEVGVESEGRGAAEGALVGGAVTEKHAELPYILLRGGRTYDSAERLHKGISATQREETKAVVQQRGAGIDAVLLEVVVDVPFGVGLRTGLHAQARDHR